MPELPEVETIKRGLEKEIVGKVIDNISVLDDKDSIDSKLSLQNDTVIRSLDRRAKYLIINLSNGNSLVIHLRMTGQLIYSNYSENKQKSSATRVLFNFRDYSHMLFNDWRKFGEIRIVKTKELQKYFENKNLGPEPLDENFKFQDFAQIINKKKRSKIKNVLLDQKIIAGLGNIYAQEACYLSNIHPERKIGTLTLSETKNLFESIKYILSEAIKFNGTSFDSAYVTSKGSAGNFFDFLSVYKKSQCKECNSKIEQIKMNSRGTYFCPKCQR